MRECVGVDGGGGGGEWRGIGEGGGGGATGFNKKQHSECIVLSHRVKLGKGSLGFGTGTCITFRTTERQI